MLNRGSVLFHVGMLQIVLKHRIQKSRTSNPNKEINNCEKNHFVTIILDIYSTTSKQQEPNNPFYLFNKW